MVVLPTPASREQKGMMTRSYPAHVSAPAHVLLSIMSRSARPPFASNAT